MLVYLVLLPINLLKYVCDPFTFCYWDYQGIPDVNCTCLFKSKCTSLAHIYI